jgi:ribose-phosphate pyrophosphokinase
MAKVRKIINEVHKVELIGNVKGKTCIIVDDMIDTAGTLCLAAKYLKEKGGAKEVYAFATHGVFSEPAADRIKESVLKKIVTTDSMQVTDIFKRKVGLKHVQVKLDLMLAEIIRRIYQKEDNIDINTVPYY